MNYWLLQDALTDIKANIIGKHFPLKMIREPCSTEKSKN